jgi:hypothetical protein
VTEYNKKNIDSFFDKVEDSVAKKQGEIVQDALEILFEFSPHFGTSDKAMSEYDANHKIQINNGPISPHIPPTKSRATSKIMIDLEKQKADNIKCGDTVEIFNTTAHRESVEEGAAVDPGWIGARRAEGYHPYEKTKFFLKG